MNKNKIVTIRVECPPELHYKFKMQVTADKTNMNRMILALIQDYLMRGGK